ncbi:Flp family type IVb pilin [Mesorhizobium loti]|nr:Flp family type IVb pilin [Mesorhizobium loti]PLP59800.1 Flp family type IVb pilin [Mesorhizobium loti]
MSLVRRFLNDETGATAIEYALVGSLMAAAIILGFGNLAGVLQWLWSDNGSKLVQAISVN